MDPFSPHVLSSLDNPWLPFFGQVPSTTASRKTDSPDAYEKHASHTWHLPETYKSNWLTNMWKECVLPDTPSAKARTKLWKDAAAREAEEAMDEFGLSHFCYYERTSTATRKRVEVSRGQAKGSNRPLMPVLRSENFGALKKHKTASGREIIKAKDIIDAAANSNDPVVRQTAEMIRMKQQHREVVQRQLDAIDEQEDEWTWYLGPENPNSQNQPHSGIPVRWDHWEQQPGVVSVDDWLHEVSRISANREATSAREGKIPAAPAA